MSSRKERNEILKGLFWKFSERMSSQGITFVISIVLARLLLPEQYGIIAMVQVFIVIANVFVTGGFTSSLIQKKDADNLDFTTIFYCTLTISVFIYGILFISSPYIEYFYEIEGLSLVTRVLGISLIITSYQTVQQAYVSRHMLFKKNFYATSLATSFSGVIGLLMAYGGFGVWALVAQSLSSIIINTITLMFIVPWKPSMNFSIDRAKQLMDYGSKILGSTLINTIYKEFNQLIIGKFFNASALALFNRGRSLPHLVVTNMDTTIRSVLFPAMSNYSDQPEKIKSLLRRGIKTGSYISFFFLTLLSVCSKPIVLILLTEKWAGCIPYMQVYCITQMFMMISGYNLQALKALGKSNEILKLEVFKKPVFIIFIIISANFSVMAVVCATLINSLYALILNMTPTSRCFDYSIKDQISDLLPAILLCIIVGITTLPISLLNLNNYLILVLQIIVGISVYIICSKICKVESFYYVKNMISEFVHKKISKR